MKINTRTWFLFNKRTMAFFLILIMVITSLIPGIIIGASNSDDVVLDTSMNGTRTSRARSIKYVDDNDTFKPTGKSQIDNVIVKDNGTLIIEDATYTIKNKLIVRDNGTVIIRDLGFLSAKYINADCKKFELTGGWIQDGVQIIIRTREPINLTDSAKIQAQGVPGSVNVDGGNGIIELMTDSYIHIIEGSILTCKGGDGVTGSGDYKDGSSGGDGIITLQANGTDSNDTSIFISKSTFEARGGKGGDGDFYGMGGNGGAGIIKILSKAMGNQDKVILDRCTKIETGGGYGGIGKNESPNGDFGDAPIFIEGNKLYVDDYKVNDEESWTPDADSTRLVSYTTTPNTPLVNIKTKNHAYLYFPHVQGYSGGQDYSILKPGNTNTIIYIYNVVRVLVVDNIDTTLEDADITIYKASQEVATGKSNVNGLDAFLIEGYKIDTGNKNKIPHTYLAKAVYQTAVGEKSFEADDRVVLVKINITLVTVTIKEIEFSGKKYTPVNGIEVAGLITVYGTTKTAGSRQIESVTLDIYRNDVLTLSGSANDTATDGKPYSTWKFYIDARDTKIFKNNDIVRVEVVATDGKFTGSTQLNLKIKHDIIPRSPVVVILNPLNAQTVDDNNPSETITISGTAYDPDRDSISQTESKEIIEISITIKNSTGHTVLTEPIVLTTGKGLKYLVDNQSYEWTTTWGSRIWSSNTEYKFPAGEYSVYVTAKDKTNLLSEERITTFNLQHSGKPPSEPPTAVVKSIKAVANAEKSNFVYDSQSETAIYTFKGDKGEQFVTLEFDLSDSYDIDGDKNDPEYLKYFVEVEEKASQGTYKTTPIIENDDFYTSDYGMTNYRVIVKVQDKWGLESKKLQVYNEKTGTNVDVSNLTIKIEFREVDPPIKGPLAFILGDALDLSLFFVHIVFIILLIIFNLAAGMIIISKFKKIGKRRKAREYALDTAKQKQMEEERVSKDDIYSHIQFVDEGAGSGQVAVAGASALSEIPQQDVRQESIEDLARPVEPEAPKLVSMEGPVYESAGTDYDLSPPEVTPVAEPGPLPAQATPKLPPAHAQIAQAAQPTQVQAQPVPAQPQPQPQPQAAQPIQAQAQPQPVPTQPQPQPQPQPQAAQPIQAQAQPQAQTQTQKKNGSEEQQ